MHVGKAHHTLPGAPGCVTNSSFDHSPRATATTSKLPQTYPANDPMANSMLRCPLQVMKQYVTFKKVNQIYKEHWRVRDGGLHAHKWNINLNLLILMDSHYSVCRLAIPGAFKQYTFDNVCLKGFGCFFYIYHLYIGGGMRKTFQNFLILWSTRWKVKYCPTELLFLVSDKSVMLYGEWTL